MGPRSNPDFSTDGQKTTLIPLVEWFQRKLEEISLTNSDAASFRTLVQHGTLSVKGYSMRGAAFLYFPSWCPLVPWDMRPWSLCSWS